MTDWIAKAVGLMHINHIKNIDVAEHLNYKPEYISMILNEKKKPKNAEKMIMTAINEIIEERTQSHY
ncbi:MAG: hypothetical protein ACI4I6_07755 [Hominimerdicola sp.]